MIDMKWFYKLENKYYKYSIKNLMLYIVTLTFATYLVSTFNPSIIDNFMLIPNLVLKGQIWRLITFLFIPPTFSPLWLIITLYFYYMIGTSLENYWGSFKFNLYYLIGTLATIAAMFITGGYGTSFYLNLSLFLAFAYLFPNMEILLFFILPIKVKYIGYVYWISLAYAVLFSPFPSKITALFSVLNFLIFFGDEIFTRAKARRYSYLRRKEFKSKLPKSKNYHHKCTVCGITDVDDPTMEFRYCSKCAGKHAYCSKHLYNHEHITEEELKSKIIEFKPKKKE